MYHIDKIYPKIPLIKGIKGELKKPNLSQFKKLAKTRLKWEKIEKNNTTFTLTTFKVVRVKVVLFFSFSAV